MPATNPNMSADPRRAARVIAHLSRPGNEGLSNKQAARDLGTNEAYIRRAKSVYRWGDTVKLDPKVIRRDGATQPRAQVDQDVVLEYADEMARGGIFLPVVVFYDGTNYWLADGFHRVMAAIYARRRRVEAEVHSGDRRDAVLYSVGANSAHGLRRTNEDKRRAVATLLMDEEWSRWSDRVIADRCKVSDRFVNGVRAELEPSANCSQIDGAVRKVERNGKTYEMKVAGINSRRESAPAATAVMEHGDEGTATEDDTPAVLEGRGVAEDSEATGGLICLEVIDEKGPDEPADAEPPDRSRREEALAGIESAWPELAVLLRSGRGAVVADETLDAIHDDLDWGA